jgi:hypothetical protein
MHTLVENSNTLGLIFPHQIAHWHIDNGIKRADVHHTQITNTYTHTTSITYSVSTVKPPFNVPTFSEIPDLVMIFSCPDNSSIETM